MSEKKCPDCGAEMIESWERRRGGQEYDVEFCTKCEYAKKTPKQEDNHEKSQAARS